MHTGTLASGQSLGLALGIWLIARGATIVITLTVLRPRTEEKYLIERFGDQYRNYITRVGRLLRKLR